MEKSPSLDVVLGDGGIKSLAALPTLNFIFENKIQVRELVGTGGGAVLAALFASNVSCEKIPLIMAKIFNTQMFSHINFKTLISLIGTPFFKSDIEDSLMNNGYFKSILEEQFHNVMIEDLSIPLAIHAVDFNSAEEVFITSGRLADAIYASNALYPLFPPIQIDHVWYVAGSFVSTLPILKWTKSKIDLTLAINIERSHEFACSNMTDFLLNFLSRSIVADQIVEHALSRDMLNSNIYYVSIQFDQKIGVVDAHAVSEILNAGTKALEIHKLVLLEKLAWFKIN